jgi:hypothetical protein
MARGILQSPMFVLFTNTVNKICLWLMDAPVVGGLVRKRLVVIRYVGRRSGNTFELPVGYWRTGDTVTIPSMGPDNKNWWRNFLGDGGPITLVDFDGQDRDGHAVANRNAKGGVSVTVRLNG